MVWEVSPWRPFEFEKMRMEMDWLWDSFLEGRPGRRTREGEEWGIRCFLILELF